MPLQPHNGEKNEVLAIRPPAIQRQGQTRHILRPGGLPPAWRCSLDYQIRGLDRATPRGVGQPLCNLPHHHVRHLSFARASSDSGVREWRRRTHDARGGTPRKSSFTSCFNSSISFVAAMRPSTACDNCASVVLAVSSSVSLTSALSFAARLASRPRLPSAHIAATVWRGCRSYNSNQRHKGIQFKDHANSQSFITFSGGAEMVPPPRRFDRAPPRQTSTNTSPRRTIIASQKGAWRNSARGGNQERTRACLSPSANSYAAII
jgi:hypothetical protein